MTIKNETIVDRVVERLKLQPLGDLITEEDLHEIVKEAIPKVFFEPRKVQDGSGYHARTVEHPPLIVEIMRELLREEARTILKNWTAANTGKLLAHWKEVTDAGLLKYVEDVQGQIATKALKEALRVWLDGFNQERQRIGLAPVYPPF